MKPTASRLELVELCPSAGALPAAHTESTTDQALGTSRHRLVERAPLVGREAALAELPEEHRDACAAIPLEEVPEGEHEVALAYNVAQDTARRLGVGLAREYGSLGPDELTGTADLVVPPTLGGRWLLVDFKGEEEVTPARRNLQLGFLALALARELGLEEVDVALGYLRGAEIDWDRATLGPFDLEAVAARVRTMHARWRAAVGVVEAGGLPDLWTGLHCARCPALALCPAHTAAARALLEDPPRPERLVLLSDEDAGRGWVTVQVLEELLAAMKASLRARAEVRGLPLPDGSRLVPVEMTRRAVLVDKALPVLRARFGDQADALVERSLSLDAVQRLARQLAPGKGQKKAADEVLGQLAAAGALRSSVHVQLRVKKARAEAEAA